VKWLMWFFMLGVFSNVFFSMFAIAQQFAAGLEFLSPAEYAALPIAREPMQFEGLPSSVDFGSFLPNIGNQGNQGSCVGWTVGYALKSYQEAQEHRWLPKNDNDHVFSPSYIYNQAVNGNCDSGMYISDALNFAKQGVLPISQFSYESNSCSRLPSQVERSSAQVFRIQEWERIPISVEATRKFLFSNRPVIIGIPVYSNFYRLGKDQIYNQTQGDIDGGHALLVVGYDDNKQAFKIMNSWGTSWGTNGFGWIGYPLYAQLVREAYVARDFYEAANDPEAMRSAIDSNDRAVVYQQIINGFGVEGILDSEGNRPLHLAVEHQKADIVDFLLDYGAYPFLPNAWGDDAIGIARHRNIADILSQLNSFISMSQQMEQAVRTNNTNIIIDLINQGFFINSSVNRESNRALHIAAETCNVRTIQTLLNNGANINALNAWGDSPLSIASSSENCVQATSLLRSNQEKQMQMRNAVDQDNVAAVKSLLDSGVSFGIGLDDQGNTPLHLATERCNEDVYNFLVGQGAKPELRNIWGDSPKSLLSANNCSFQ
jgi:ankyrin repeat protein